MAESLTCPICGKSCQVARGDLAEVEATREAAIIGAARYRAISMLVDEWDRAAAELRALFLRTEVPTEGEIKPVRARMVEAEVSIWTFRAGFYELDDLERRRRGSDNP